VCVFKTVTLRQCLTYIYYFKVQFHKSCAQQHLRKCNKSPARPGGDCRLWRSKTRGCPVPRLVQSLWTLSGSSHRTWRHHLVRHNRSYLGRTRSRLKHECGVTARISTLTYVKDGNQIYLKVGTLMLDV